MFSGDGPPSFSSIRTTNHQSRSHTQPVNKPITGFQIQGRTVNPRLRQSQPSVTSVDGVNPPSFTDIRHGQHTFLHQNGNGEDDQPPSHTALVHTGGNSHIQNRGVGQSQPWVSSVDAGGDPPSVNEIRHGQQNFFDQNLAYGCDEPPSVGDMTKGKVSETSGMDGYNYGQPPSRDDIAGREKEAALTGSQSVDPQELVGMSMVRISESSIRRHMRRTKM